MWVPVLSMELPAGSCLTPTPARARQWPPVRRPGRPSTQAALSFVWDAVHGGPGAGTGGQGCVEGVTLGLCSGVGDGSSHLRCPSVHQAGKRHSSTSRYRGCQGGWESREGGVLPTAEPWGPHAGASLPSQHTGRCGKHGPLDSAFQAIHTLIFLSPFLKSPLLPLVPVPVRKLGPRCGGDPFFRWTWPASAGRGYFCQFTPQACERGQSDTERRASVPGTSESPCRAPCAGGLPIIQLCVVPGRSSDHGH